VSATADIAAPSPPTLRAPAAEPAGGARARRLASLAGRAAVPLFFAVLAIAFVGPALLPGRALLPVDNLFLYPPWRAYAAEYGVQLPHNPLIGDSILQNYSWKRLAAESFAAGEFPLWNPYILAGQPFLAAGQNGSLYPFGVLFFVVPLAQAYAWFIAVHLWLGALFAYWLARIVGANRLGGIVSGITFGFCGYLVVSFLWPMVVSTAIWLPALLATIELLIRGPGGPHPRPGRPPPPAPSPNPGGEESCSTPPGLADGAGVGAARPVGMASVPALLALGAAIVGMQFLAGHMEMSLYLLLTAGLYTGLRLVGEIWARRGWRAVAIGLAALLMVGLGAALAAVQLIPFAEVVGANVRTGWSDYDETVGYALSRQRLVSFLVPDYFGNPSHHTYLDLLDGRVRSVEHLRPNREPRSDTEWGGKNYVEGTVYLGVLPLLLAAVGVAARRTPARLALAIVAVVALLLAFGTPLYALLFYGVPGANQLHTPFRWVYPFGLCVAVLAGLGASALAPNRPHVPPGGQVDSRPGAGPGGDGGARAWAARIGLTTIIAAGVLLLALAVALVFQEASLTLAARALGRWPELRGGFGEARALLSYQYLNLLGSALLLAASGGILWLGARRPTRLLGVAAVALLVGDLFSFGMGFNTAAATRPLGLVPSAIEAIRADPGLFRVVTYGEDDTLPSNTNMLFGLQDVRGYDTIILRDYVEYLELLEPQRGIPFSKVAKLFDERSLSSPLLDLLNVKYVLTSKRVTQPGYSQVFEGEGIRVYRNERALPRAFVLTGAKPAADRAAALAMVGDPAFDPRRLVVLEEWDGAARPSAGVALPATVLEYGNNRVVVEASAPDGGFLVLGDVHFPGWTVTLDGAARPLLRANALLRAVELPPGQHRVTFEYRPLSFRIGGFISLIAAVGLVSLFGLAAWQRLGPLRQPATAGQRVLKNSTFPMATSLLNKVVDVGFALVMFRVLQAEGVGAYTFAGVLVGYFDILVGFGLGTLITREVARDHATAARYLGNTLALRLALWVASAAVVVLLIGPAAGPLGITPPVALTIWLLLLALLPGILSGALSALFMAHERMEHPAAVTVLSTLLKVSLGLVALLGGWGYVGLAAVSVVTNVLTAIVLLGLYVWTIGWPGVSLDLGFARRMADLSLPLMLNNLLNSIFFRIDALLLKPLAGDAALGWYSTAYKFIDGLQIIPSSFVLAVFPLLSRQAETDREQLARTYAISLKVLLIVALPISVGTTLLAEPIILLFAGPTYLPQSAYALQILIWFLPISFVNGLTQYVLIAINRQRWITVSFLVGSAFNLAANLLLIPTYGYLAASAVTVASELALFAPFWRVIRRDLPPIDLLGLAWRPTLAAILMAGPVWALRDWSTILAVPVGGAVYCAALLALRAFDAAERSLVLGALRR
jgi:O-antigen/teichoic acid export membrane protein